MPLERGMIPDTKELSRGYDEMEVEKPWCVYKKSLRFPDSLAVGKIVREYKHSGIIYDIWIRYCTYEPKSIQVHDPKIIPRFDNSLKAIAYLLTHKSRSENPHKERKREAITQFLSDFPDKRANLEKLLAQS
jgi:hypothetical protein